MRCIHMFIPFTEWILAFLPLSIYRAAIHVGFSFLICCLFFFFSVFVKDNHLARMITTTEHTHIFLMSFWCHSNTEKKIFFELVCRFLVLQQQQYGPQYLDKNVCTWHSVHCGRCVWESFLHIMVVASSHFYQTRNGSLISLTVCVCVCVCSNECVQGVQSSYHFL